MPPPWSSSRERLNSRASRVVFWVGVLGYVVAATVAIAAADLRIFPRGSAAIVGLDGWGLATLWAQVLLAGPFEEMLIVVLPAMLLVGRTGKVRFTVRAVVTLCAVGALLRVLPHLYYAAGAQQSVLPIPDVVAAVAGVVVWAGMWTTVSTLLYVRYGRLWPLIVMHLVWDVVAAVVATIAWSGSVYVAAAALVVVALIVWAERGRPRPELAPSDMTRDRARSGQSAR
jgi:membrane protease YdiL (CAAX protease family)